MRLGTTVVIPALNEAGNIARLVQQTGAQAVDAVIVVDNGSSDGTGPRAREAGATVITEPRRGYGYACAAGTAAALQQGAGVVVYMDGDFSSLPTELPRLLAPIQAGEADLVLGSRYLGNIAGGAMLAHQRFGNRLSAWLQRLLYGLRVTDLGPYRAIRGEWIASLDMQEMTFGWPTEMTVKVARRGGRIVEVPVTWHPRHSGRSKVSGTLRGSILAAYYILGVTLRHAPYRRRMGRLFRRFDWRRMLA
jgi:glycosyltransferase involved in cell wall biosynthesis